LRTPLVRAAVRRFLEHHFADGDQAAVVSTSGGDAAGQGLTDNRQLLLAAVDRFTGSMLPSVTLSRTEEYRRTQDTRDPNERVRDPEAAMRAHYARNSLDTLKNVVDWLSTIHGRRKAVLFVSEGIDYDMYDPFNNREASDVLDSLRRSTAAAAGANVSFYPIDPRGLGGLSDEMMEIQPVFDNPTLGLDESGLRNDLRLAQDSLRVLADETSGIATVNTNDFAGAFDRIVKDSSVYYLLGYYPPGQKRDGRAHKLEVKVNREGLRVRARAGYTSPRGKKPEPPAVWARSETPAALVDLLRSPLPRPGLPLSVQAAVFRGEKDRASVMVAVQVAPDSFRFTEKEGVFHDILDLSVIAVDAVGKVSSGVDQKVNLDLKPQTRQAVEAAGFRVLAWLDLPRGRYQIRVAGRSVNKDLTGSVYSDLVVPDFGKEPLALSGLVLTSAIARHVPTAGSPGLLKDVLPGAPTTWRGFHAQDTLALVTEIYDGEKSAHTLDVVTTLTAADGTVAHRGADERKVPALADRGPRPAILHSAQVPLKTVAPGHYILRVAATSRMGQKPPSVARELALEVVPLETPPAR
jgi:VWFA-related protein